METRISATELARRLGDVIGRVRYRHESFVVVRNGEPVARLIPVMTAPPGNLKAIFEAWRAAGPPDDSFADDLERVGAADRPPENPWVS
ncbi:MAG: type II toxin-antitoxin system Phd/YefM family antitoxin [Candidatus Rokubacteria bacterium]|nr:type II toxin-antitoxin system Phd/YefM family antitoxin [Candidatus Rokubacteria bacterium]MBI4627965.1 type II toxin-antitoxin system Phd/YefM family antitoxin [Candidatus Rokubacteria bacterium]